jgi:hypothetical protein
METEKIINNLVELQRRTINLMEKLVKKCEELEKRVAKLERVLENEV